MISNDPIHDARALVSALQEQARDFPQSRKRDLQLYGVLAGALRLVQLLERDNLLARHHELLPEGKFLTGQSDVYTLAAKLVFDDRFLAYRASYCLRGLGASGVAPEHVVTYLREHGGMNCFAADRRKQLATVSTRFLRLDNALVIPRGGRVTLTLQHVQDTHFAVEKVEVRK